MQILKGSLGKSALIHGEVLAEIRLQDVVKRAVGVELVIALLTCVIRLLGRPDCHHFVIRGGADIQLKPVFLRRRTEIVLQVHFMDCQTPRAVSVAHGHDLVAPDRPAPAKVIVLLQICRPLILLVEEAKFAYEFRNVVVRMGVKTEHQAIIQLVAPRISFAQQKGKVFINSSCAFFVESPFLFNNSFHCITRYVNTLQNCCSQIIAIYWYYSIQSYEMQGHRGVRSG